MVRGVLQAGSGKRGRGNYLASRIGYRSIVDIAKFAGVGNSSGRGAAEPRRRTGGDWLRPPAVLTARAGISHANSARSAVIQLPPHSAQPQPRDAIGLAAARRDQAAPLELPEQAERAVAQHMPVAGEAVCRQDAAGVGTAAVLDTPALRPTPQSVLCGDPGSRVQHALFVSGNVHGGNARQSKERLRRRRAAVDIGK